MIFFFFGNTFPTGVVREEAEPSFLTEPFKQDHPRRRSSTRRDSWDAHGVCLLNFWALLRGLHPFFKLDERIQRGEFVLGEIGMFVIVFRSHAGQV